MTTLQQWVASQEQPEVPVNENFESLSAIATYSKRHPVTTGLTWGYYGGLYNGNTISDGTVTLTNAADSYVVVLRSTGVVSVSTSSTNSLDPLYAKLYKITTAGGVVTAVVDQRFDANGLFFSGTGGGGSGGTEFRGLTFTSDTGSTAASDPGNGLFKWNNATQASATALYFDNQTLDAVSLTTLYGNFTSTGFIYLQQADDATKWHVYRWSAQADSTGYRTFTVVSQATGGAIADDKTVYVLFQNLGSSGGGGTVGKHMLPVMASSMFPRATSPCGTLQIDGGATDQPDVAYLPFSGTSVEYAVFAIPMPESWDEGTLTFRPIWKHPATTTNFGVVFSLQGVAFSDDDALAANFGTAQTSTDTGGTTADHYIGPESSAITIAGTPQAGDTVFFRLARETANGSDTMAVDGHLIGIRLYYTTAAETD